VTPDEALEALGHCRQRIDDLDVGILDLLNQRTVVVQEIGRIKQTMTMPIYEPKREEMVFANVMGNNQGPLPNDAVKRLFERIIDEMRTVQKAQMERK
jgi:chorismate mutase